MFIIIVKFYESLCKQNNCCVICKKKMYFSMDMYFSYNLKKSKDCFVNKYAFIIEECYFFL